VLLQELLERRDAVLLRATGEVPVTIEERLATGATDVSEAVVQLAAQIVDVEDPDAKRHGVGVAEFVLNDVCVAARRVGEPSVDPRRTPLGVAGRRVELLGHHAR